MAKLWHVLLVPPPKAQARLVIAALVVNRLNHSAYPLFVNNGVILARASQMRILTGVKIQARNALGNLQSLNS